MSRLGTVCSTQRAVLGPKTRLRFRNKFDRPLSSRIFLIDTVAGRLAIRHGCEQTQLTETACQDGRDVANTVIKQDFFFFFFFSHKVF